MADPHLTSYVGMWTGIIGAITGVTGAIMGYVSYRKSSSLKALDLRLRLQQEINIVKAIYENLIRLMEEADKSRKETAAALGFFKSGFMDKWKVKEKSDGRSLLILTNKAKDCYIDDNERSQKRLEAKLINLHRVKIELEKLTEQYQKAISWDKEQMKQHREDQRAAAARPKNLAQKPKR